MTHKLPPARAASPLQKICAVLLATLLVLPAYAQTATGRLTVTVKDPRGEAAVGAPVTVINQDAAQTVRTAVTDQQGVAVIENLPPGLYTVLVSVAGFRADPLRDVAVRVGETATAAVQLARRRPPARRGGGGRTPAAVDPTLAGEDPGAAEPAEPRQELSSIPNVNLDLTPLLQVVPGAVATGPSSLGRVIIDGKGNDQQTVRLDGIDYTIQAEFPSADSAVNPVTSFQKAEVGGDLDGSATRSGAFGYEPRHGPGSGSVSEVPTYAGPFSSWQAQFYGEHRNDGLNARNFFDYDGENAIRRTRFGGKFGKALGETQRTGIFLAYDGWRGRVERNVYEAVPADATNGAATGPLAQLMRGFLPPGTTVMPVEKSLDANYVVARRRNRTTVESNSWDARVDFRPFFPGPDALPEDKAAPKAVRTLTFRLTHQNAENHVPEGVTGRSQRQRFNFINGVTALKWVKRREAVPSEFERRQSKLDDFGHLLRFGFNVTRARMNAENVPATGFDLSQSLITTGSTVPVAGLPLAPPPPDQKSSVPVATLGGLISGSGRGLDLRPVSHTVGYDYSRVLRADEAHNLWSHELYAGFEARLIQLDYDRLGGITYAFPGVAALRAGTPASVTFLSDLRENAPFSEGFGRRHARQQFYMGYLQFRSQAPWSDKPRLGTGLTLTYGLRYDYFSRVRERDNRAVVVDPATGRMLPAGSHFYRADKVNFQPRFGFAYRLGEGPNTKNTVLRAGVGLYSGVPRIGDLTLPIDSDRFSTGVTGGVFPASPADVISGFVNTPGTRQFQPLAFARDFSPLERSIKWDVRLSHLRNGYEFSGYYIGNVGRNLALANFANRITRVQTNPDPTKPALVVREFDDVRDGLVFKPLGEFFYRRGGGRSRFNAMSLQLARDASTDPKVPSGEERWTSFKKWLRYPLTSFSAKYTLSHSVGNASGTLMSNPLDPDADYGDNSGVPRHNFTLSGAYDIWRVGKTRFTPAALLTGWRVMPLLKLSSGLPLTVRLTRPDILYRDSDGNFFDSPAAGLAAVLNTPGGGGAGGAYVPDLVAGANPYPRGTADRLVLDPAAFSIPAPGALGNVRRGQFKGPPVFQLDLSLRRNLFSMGWDQTTEKDAVRGEFQVDIYNVFNRANFFNPASALPNALGTNADTQIQPGVPFKRIGAGTFGFVNAADQGRIIQFTLTLRFNQGFTK